MILVSLAVLGVQALIVVASGAALDSTEVSAVIAGIFIIVNQVLTFFLQGQLDDRKRDREAGRAKKKNRRAAGADNGGSSSSTDL